MRTLTASLVLFALPAWAMPGFVSDVPNATQPELVDGRPCRVCHVRPQGGGELNPFGKDYDRNRGGQGWAQLFMVDSDGDDLTNGMELGDPRGIWTPGATPERTTRLSLPGDPESRRPPLDPDAGVADSGRDDLAPGDLNGDGLGPRDEGQLADLPSADLGPTDAEGRDLGMSDLGTAPLFESCTCSRRPPAGSTNAGLVLLGLAGCWLFRWSSEGALQGRRRT